MNSSYAWCDFGEVLVDLVFVDAKLGIVILKRGTRGNLNASLARTELEAMLSRFTRVTCGIRG